MCLYQQFKLGYSFINMQNEAKGGKYQPERCTSYFTHSHPLHENCRSI